MKRVRAGVSAGDICFSSAAVLLWYYYSRQWSFYDEVLQRCSLYSPDATLRVDADCNKIAEAFTKAVAFKDPKSIGAGDYQALMMLVNQQNFPCNKVLFWSKTKELAYSYQGDLLTLNKLLVAHIADNLTWCGDKSSSEVKHGPFQEENGICPIDPTRVFWEVAAKWFAENACGKVHVLLNGSSKESVTYNKKSVFATAEVGNLSSAVTELKACVIHDSEARDSCSDASINELNLTLSRKNISFTYEDKDRDTFLECLKNHGV